MFSFHHNNLKPPGSPLRTFRWNVLFKDLNLFISLCQARLMVSRELRRRSKERAARLKHIRMAPGTSHNEFIVGRGDRKC
jgi:hypothetical protein